MLYAVRMTHTDIATPPFARLTPDGILNAMESVGYSCDGRLLTLNSYENRVYQVGTDEGVMRVAKFYRPQRWSRESILEEHDFARELAKADLPVVPPLAHPNGQTLHEFDGFYFAVFPRQGGYAPELDQPSILRRMGRLIGRLHAIGSLSNYQSRPTLDLVSFGEEPRDYLLEHDFIPLELRQPWLVVVEQALDGIRKCYDRAGDLRLLRLHGDCYAGNILWTEEGPHLVDFDDSRMGPAVQDLWMLLTGDREEMKVRIPHLLEGYETFHDFDPRELNLIEALRTLRLIHYSAWIARRWTDPAFPVAFPWFESPRYWQDRIHELREQVLAMQTPWFAV